MDKSNRRRFSIPSPSRRKRVLLALGYYDQRLHRGTARYAREAGWILDTHMVHFGVVPSHFKGDGIITALFPHRADLLEYVRSCPAHVVDLAQNVDLELPRVILENEQIGQQAAEHLIERGFQHLAFVKYTDTRDIQERMDGFSRTVLSAGRTLHLLDWPEYALSPQGQGMSCFDWLLQEVLGLPKPVGVMVQSDDKAMFLLNTCEAAGIRIPEQVAVVGVDNDELACEFAPVALSSVDSNLEELAYQGAALLDTAT